MKLLSLFTALFIFLTFISGSCQNKNEKAFISVNQNGKMLLFGQPVSDLETLKFFLIDSLSRMPEIPQKIEIDFIGEVGMGLRHELQTIAIEAIEQAKVLKSAPEVEILLFSKQQGADCEKAPEVDKTDCAIISLQYPSVKTGEKLLQESVEKWVLAYLSGVLTANNPEIPENISIERGAEIFFNTFIEFKGTELGGLFEASTGSQVVFNNGNYLTLAMHGYSYLGGAHGSSTQAIGTFNSKTGAKLTWSDLVTDTLAVKTLIEKRVREVKAEVFNDGFEFDEIFKFVLAQSFGLTREGILLVYQEYEIMPYAMGETEVVITFEELENLSKIKF
jgi:hypothetical protein